MTRRNVKQRAVAKTALVNTEQVKEKEMVKYTKTEINRMSTAELKDLAKENGIDDELTGAEIKKALIAKFGL